MNSARKNARQRKKWTAFHHHALVIFFRSWLASLTDAVDGGLTGTFAHQNYNGLVVGDSRFDLGIHVWRTIHGHNQYVAQALMIPRSVIVIKEASNNFSRRVLAEENQFVKAFGFGACCGAGGRIESANDR